MSALKGTPIKGIRYRDMDAEEKRRLDRAPRKDQVDALLKELHAHRAGLVMTLRENEIAIDHFDKLVKALTRKLKQHVREGKRTK